MEPLTLFFKDIKIESILDVGTGKGDFLKVLVKIFPDSQMTAIDPNASSLDEARKKFPDAFFQKMTAENLLFDNDSFDLASISMALHHLRKINKGLKEMKRVVKPGGWIILNELISDRLTPAQEVHKLYHHFRSRIDRMTGICHRETFTRVAILDMLKRAGITTQFFFEYNQEIDSVRDKTEIDLKVRKMAQSLEKIKGRKEYELMRPQIDEFRERAVKYGFEPATQLVVAGRSK